MRSSPFPCPVNLSWSGRWQAPHRNGICTFEIAAGKIEPCPYALREFPFVDGCKTKRGIKGDQRHGGVHIERRAAARRNESLYRLMCITPVSEPFTVKTPSTSRPSGCRRHRATAAAPPRQRPRRWGRCSGRLSPVVRPPYLLGPAKFTCRELACLHVQVERGYRTGGGVAACCHARPQPPIGMLVA